MEFYGFVRGVRGGPEVVVPVRFGGVACDSVRFEPSNFEICPSLSGFTAHAVHGHGARFKLHKTPREWRESGRGIIEQNGANSGKTSSTLETLKPAPVAGFVVFWSLTGVIPAFPEILPNFPIIPRHYPRHFFRPDLTRRSGWKLRILPAEQLDAAGIRHFFCNESFLLGPVYCHSGQRQRTPLPEVLTALGIMRVTR